MTMIKLIAAAAITVVFGYSLATTTIGAAIAIVIAMMMMMMTSIGNIAAGIATATVHVVGKTAIAFRSDPFGSAHDLEDLKAVLQITEREVQRAERWTSLFCLNALTLDGLAEFLRRGLETFHAREDFQ